MNNSRSASDENSEKIQFYIWREFLYEYMVFDPFHMREARIDEIGDDYCDFHWNISVPMKD